MTKRDVDRLISEAIDILPSPLIRRTGPGLVLLSEEAGYRAQVMRWGFSHQKYREVNNTRSESLKSPFWADSLRERRCLVPISEFYEWQEVPTGAPKGLGKPCFSFSRPDGDWFWVAGIWQHFDNVGDCYSTITTSPPAAVEPIHDRMLAVLEWDQALAFLAGDKMAWTPYEGKLTIKEVPSPLKRQRKAPLSPLPPPQGELF